MREFNGISVIMPVYNSEKYLLKMMNSIKYQTYDNFELIIINDGSTDSSDVLIKNFIKKNKKLFIKYFYVENKGVSNARNIGLYHAEKTHILFVDSDDYLEPHALEKLSKSADKYDLIVGGMEIDYLNSKQFLCVDDTKIEKSEVFLLYKKNLLSSLCNKLFCKQIIIDNKLQFDINVKVGEDYSFVLEYIKYMSSEIHVIKDIVYKYFLRNNGSNKKIRENFDKNSKMLYDKTVSYFSCFKVPYSNILEVNYFFVKNIFRRYKDWLFQNRKLIQNFLFIKKSYKELKIYNLYFDKSKKYFSYIVRNSFIIQIFLYFAIKKIIRRS